MSRAEEAHCHTLPHALENVVDYIELIMMHHEGTSSFNYALLKKIIVWSKMA